MKELRNCPFCGSEADTSLDHGTPQVFCKEIEKCGIFMLDFDSPFLDEVILKWNKRAKDLYEE
jgi:hypothetical protein